MRIDIVSIFPEYLAPLRLSLPGKAQDAGLVDVQVHDLRQWAHDRHRTVDDTPYGGGAGMVMKPEPWGEALDALVADGSEDDIVLVVPTPGGTPFTQRTASELAGLPRLVIACGRYEGIDQRVLDHAATRMQVREVSVGDYVLNGGEAAALVVVEAVVRLLPGVVGNPESLVEESHGDDGLLEYPLYTKPASWRGLDVPPVLLGGDHARIAAWRREQALRRTASRRPDLLPPAAVLDDVEIRAATLADAGEIMTLQRASFAQLQRENRKVHVDELSETLEEVRSWASEGRVLVAVSDGRMVGFGWGKVRERRWRIARLGVAPDLTGRGLGRALLAALETARPPDVTGFEAMTGQGSDRNLRFYKRAGYRGAGTVAPGIIRLVKDLPDR